MPVRGSKKENNGFEFNFDNPEKKTEVPKSGSKKVTKQQESGAKKVTKRPYKRVPEGKGGESIVREQNLNCPHCGANGKKFSTIYNVNKNESLKQAVAYRQCKKCNKRYTSLQYFEGSAYA